jgi:hypothetical protein
MNDRYALSTKAKTLLVLGIILVAVLVAGIAPHAINSERRRRTLRTLESLRGVAQTAAQKFDTPRRRLLNRTHILGIRSSVALDPRNGAPVGVCGTEGPVARDGWGNAITVQIPGPIHKGGWDAWSPGPNGIDELGRGDDLVVGEDLWPPPTALDWTLETLRGLATLIRESPKPILADGSATDPTGLWSLAEGIQRQRSTTVEISGCWSRQPGRHATSTPQFGSVEFIDADDGWNHPVMYRCPGPVHPHGWDLYSIGPNGIDEQGRGDDILVGEDVAEVASSR